MKIQNITNTEKPVHKHRLEAVNYSTSRGSKWHTLDKNTGKTLCGHLHLQDLKNGYKTLRKPLPTDKKLKQVKGLGKTCHRCTQIRQQKQRGNNQ